jgi:integrase
MAARTQPLLYRVRKAAARAGFKGRVTLHQFRRTFGTRYGEAHGVRNAQLLLGHESIVTTEKYLAGTKIPKPAVEAVFEDVVGK